ncbi:MAG: hypothetical protein ACI9FB_000913 [Candidatus Azotimanducaceae bacterium]|jgi:hypothetical protein
MNYKSTIYYLILLITLGTQSLANGATEIDSFKSTLHLESIVSGKLSTASVAAVKISPSGDFLAVKILQFGKYKLNFLDRETLAYLGELAFAQNREVGEFYWANDTRVIAEVHQLTPGSKVSQYSGELVAINYSGEFLSQIQVGIDNKSLLAIKIVDPLPDNSENVLVSSLPMASINGTRGIAILLNVFDEIDERQIALLPEAPAHFHVDNNGDIQVTANQNTVSYKGKRSSALASHIGASPTKTGF